ncbi:hypothetical protein [Streptomyces brasiliscabiei]|uniref:Uncharacterized protein n=1 Tax=Streptomyces brasiliscabiei TaxID=2736302 RepID=A0ABU8G423_9ACTN
MDLVNAFSPLMGQHAHRAAQTAIIVPELISPDDDAPPAAPSAVLRRITAAVWAHDPASPQ